MSKKLSKLIVVLGPTASGKTNLAIKLAKKFNGEIISADSRQVYRGMDIGTGKITKKEMEGIPHYLLDVASPKRKFTIAQYRKLTLQAINKITKKRKIPILCGGTAFYVRATINGISIPEMKPDWELRKKLEKKSVGELYKMLKKMDPRRAKTIEKENPRRLIRAIEIILKTKKPVSPLREKPLPCPILIIGIKKSPAELKKLIRKRLLKRLKKGMVAEVKKLRKSGISWKRLEEFGLEYRFIAQYLQRKLKYNEMVEKIQRESEHFAKRQMTWFKKDERIRWIRTYPQAEKLTRKFIKN